MGTSDSTAGSRGWSKGQRARIAPGPDLRRTTLRLWTIIVVLFVLWALGLIGSIGGAAIHLLLVSAVIVLAAQLLQGRRSV